MSNIDVLFCRHLLAQLAPMLAAAKMRVNKDAWVWHYSGDHWEFHGPRDFYWFGSAGNAYEARYKGWSAWLEKYRSDLCQEEKTEMATAQR